MQQRLCGREQEFGMKILPEFIPPIAENPKSIELDGASEGHPECQRPSESNQFEAWRTAIVTATIDEIGRQLSGYSLRVATAPHFWLANGGLVYLDLSNLEFACAEGRACSLDGVLQEKASELIVSSAAEAMEKSGLEELSFYKNNTGPRDEENFFIEYTYGSHHNYSYLAEAQPMIWYLLANFLPATLPFSGNGHIQKTADGRFVYALSERAPYIELANGKISATETTDHRTLLNERNESCMDPGAGLGRLHLISRDATRCELQTWLVDAMTHFVLRLAEEGWKLPFCYRIVEPVAELHQINRALDQGWDHRIRCHGGGKDFLQINLWDYNQLFLDYAKQLNPLSEMEKKALEEWARILELLRAGAFEELVGELDWATKRFVLKGKMKQDGFGLDSVKAYVLCREYHNISPSPQKSLFALLAEEGFVRHLVSREEVEQARLLAPKTRARSRGEFVKLCAVFPEIKEQVQRVTWDGVGIRSKNSSAPAQGELINLETGHRTSQNPDAWFGERRNPFSPTSSSLEAFYKDISLPPAA